MPKLIATLNVIAWSGFWAFGYLALSSSVEDSTRMVVALFMAAIGAGVGLYCWIWLVRHSEATGYAKPARRVYQNTEEESV